MICLLLLIFYLLHSISFLVTEKLQTRLLRRCLIGPSYLSFPMSNKIGSIWPIVRKIQHVRFQEANNSTKRTELNK